MEAALSQLVFAFEQILNAIGHEISLIEGNYLQPMIASVNERIQNNVVGRTMWILIAILFISGLIAAICLIVGLVSLLNRRKSVSQTSSKNNHEIEFIEISSPPRLELEEGSSEDMPPTIIGKLKAGQINAAEEALTEEWKKNPQDTNLIMYLAACRLLKNDEAAYDEFAKRVFEQRLDSNDEVCRHIAELGRILSPYKFNKSKYPPPGSALDFENELLGDSLGAVSELGDVETLLDLIRVYTDMGNKADARHLIVEALVRGNEKQRKRAVKYVSPNKESGTK